MITVHDFGAVGDGATDDRDAIQRALDAGAGGVVWVPIGTYLVSKSPAGAWCLNIPASTTLVGEGTLGNSVLIQAPGIAANVRLLQCAAPGIAVDTIILDGNASAQVADEHRAGVFALGAGLLLQNVIARNFTGDGFEISIGSNGITVDGCTATANLRNGLTFGGGSIGAVIKNCKLFGNRVQQLDTEPGPGFRVDDVEVTGCTIGPGVGDYAMTVSGSGASSRSGGWNIHHNTVIGSLEVVWANDIDIHHNKITNSTNKPSVFVYRACSRVNIFDNELSLLQPAVGTVPADAVIGITGTGPGQMPDWVSIANNQLSSSTGPAHGIHLSCAGNAVVRDNEIMGAGIADPYASGVYARTTVDGAPMPAVVVHDNLICNWGKFGVSLAGNGPAIMRVVSVIDNIFADNNAVPTMITAMSLPVAQDLRVGLNTLMGGCTIEQNLPFAGAHLQPLGVTRWTV
jgi:hypothetical protein